MMKKILLLSVACVSLLVLSPKTWAQDAEATKTLFGDFLKEYDFEVTGSATLDYYSRYVWRGQYLDTDGVLQPGASVSAKGFTAGYWGSFDAENRDALNSDESDYYAQYTYTYDILSITGGHTWYGFPGGHTNTKEFYGSLSLATFLTPTLYFAHDYDEGENNADGDGNYYSLSLSQSVPLIKNPGVSLELGVTGGYIDGQWLAGEGFHVTPTVGVKIPVTANFSLTPTFGYNATFEDLRDSAIGNAKNKVFGGVKSSFAF